jgi:glucose-1-phosphate cytidylyltransferase
MKTFSAAGHTDFVLALGEGGEAIRRHFLFQHIEGRDIEIEAGTGHVGYLAPSAEDCWKIKCVDTGVNAQTGARLARCRRHLGEEPFFVTYSDCLCNVDLTALRAAHAGTGLSAMVTGVRPSSRFGTFALSAEGVTGYQLDARLAGQGGYLNGGYMVMDTRIFDHLTVLNECNLERDVFPALVAARAIGVFPHEGYWQAVDTERDLQQVTQLHLENRRPWLSLGG